MEVMEIAGKDPLRAPITLALEMEFIGVGWISLGNDPMASKALRSPISREALIQGVLRADRLSVASLIENPVLNPNSRISLLKSLPLLLFTQLDPKLDRAGPTHVESEERISTFEYNPIGFDEVDHFIDIMCSSNQDSEEGEDEEMEFDYFNGCRSDTKT
ncbi:unnamed protein product [Microthlaspi erraticum]|uniref:Uncharacterized protein n=1 Tax=Microthlaspi erraticum TaxID=1685480 RepID=A0A6D2JER7_9BRAS|nr:unnamed protein product [Microthlaspi erraticum]